MFQQSDWLTLANTGDATLEQKSSLLQRELATTILQTNIYFIFLWMGVGRSACASGVGYVKRAHAKVIPYH